MDSMKNDNKIIITNERREDMVDAIKIYFSEERGEEIGDLRAKLILDFTMEKMAPEFYNQGVSDSCQYMKNMIEDVLSIQK
jgi:uncharacterized protein (DUF2164 family)